MRLPKGKPVQVRIEGPRAGRPLRWAVTLLTAAGLACLALFLFYVFETSYFQASLRHTFAEQRQRSLENDLPPKYADGGPGSSRERPGDAQAEEAADDLVGRLEIPRIGVDVMVLNGTDPETLRRSAGWMSETARPGDRGNAAIAAHRDTYFRPLRQVRKGDEIQVTTLDASYQYRVQWTAVVAPDDVSVLEPTGKPALTLITCYPFYYVGKAPQRFIVRATRQDTRPASAN